MDRILRCNQGVEDVCFVVQDHWLPWLSAGSRRIDHFGLGMSYCLKWRSSRISSLFRVQGKGRVTGASHCTSGCGTCCDEGSWVWRQSCEVVMVEISFLQRLSRPQNRNLFLWIKKKPADVVWPSRQMPHGCLRWVVLGRCNLEGRNRIVYVSRVVVDLSILLDELEKVTWERKVVEN